MKRLAIAAIVIVAAVFWSKAVGAQELRQLPTPAVDPIAYVEGGVADVMWPRQLVLSVGLQEAAITYEVQQRIHSLSAGWTTLPYGGYAISFSDMSQTPIVASIGTSEHPVGDDYRWRVRAKAAGFADSEWSQTVTVQVLTTEPLLAAVSYQWLSDTEIQFDFADEIDNDSFPYWMFFVSGANNSAPSYDRFEDCWVRGGPSTGTVTATVTCSQTDFGVSNCHTNGCHARIDFLQRSSAFTSAPSASQSDFNVLTINPRNQATPTPTPTPTATPAPIPTEAPSGLAVSSVSGSTVSLEWDRLGAADTHEYEIAMIVRGARITLPSSGVPGTTVTIDNDDSNSNITAVLSSVPTLPRSFSVRGVTDSGAGPWSGVVSTLSLAPPAPTPTATTYAGQPNPPTDGIYTSEVPQVDRRIDDDNLTLTWGEIVHATHYDVRLNDRVLRLETTGLAEQQVVVDLAEHDDVILRYAVRAAVVAGATQIDIANDDDEVVFIIAPYTAAVSQWSDEGFVRLVDGTLSGVEQAEAAILATPEVSDVAFDIVSTVGQAVG